LIAAGYIRGAVEIQLVEHCLLSVDGSDGEILRWAQLVCCGEMKSSQFSTPTCTTVSFPGELEYWDGAEGYEFACIGSPLFTLRARRGGLYSMYHTLSITPEYSMIKSIASTSTIIILAHRIHNYPTQPVLS